MIDKKLKTKYNQNTISVSIVSGMISSLFSILSGLNLNSHIVFNFMAGFGIGFLIPFVYIKLSYLFIANKRIKSLPYVIYIAINFFCLFFVTMTIYIISGLLFFRAYIFTNMVFTLIITVALAFFFTIRSTFEQFIGKEVLKYIFLGKYHNPKEEENIVAFVDLANSTDWAEKLDPVNFFRLINDFILIIEQCAELHNGNIYKYLGDGLIVVWKSSPKSYDDLSNFLCDLTGELTLKQSYFRKTYGNEVEFSLGINEGMLMVGELGFNRKEIGYFGDTINVSSRLAGICGVNNTSIILSSDLYTSLNKKGSVIQENFRMLDLGSVLLRGKKNEIVLVKLNRL